MQLVEGQSTSAVIDEYPGAEHDGHRPEDTNCVGWADGTRGGEGAKASHQTRRRYRGRSIFGGRHWAGCYLGARKVWAVSRSRQRSPWQRARWVSQVRLYSRFGRASQRAKGGWQCRVHTIHTAEIRVVTPNDDGRPGPSTGLASVGRCAHATRPAMLHGGPKPEQCPLGALGLTAAIRRDGDAPR